MAPKTKITTATVPPEVGSAWRRMWGCKGAGCAVVGVMLAEGCEVLGYKVV